MRIVDIDDDSLERLCQWTWSRATIAVLVHRLMQAGAGVVGFDAVFAEPDRRAPENILPTWAASGLPEVAALKTKMDQLPNPDAVLASLLAQDGVRVVTGFVLNNDRMPRRPVENGRFAHGGDHPALFVPRYPGAVANLTEIEKAAQGNGSFNMVPDRDGIVRRVPTIVALLENAADGELPPTLYPSLHQEALRVFQGASTLIAKASGASGVQSFGEQTGLSELRNGRVTIKTDASGMVVMHQADKTPDRYVSAWKVFEDGFDPTPVAGHIVLVGPSAAGLLDLRATPLDPALPGEETPAQVLEQELLGHFLTIIPQCGQVFGHFSTV